MKKGELLAEIDAKDFEIQARTDSAEIARQAVAEGDYVKVGDLLFTLVGTRVLRAQLPPAWQGAPRGLRGCAPR